MPVPVRHSSPGGRHGRVTSLVQRLSAGVTTLTLLLAGLALAPAAAQELTPRAYWPSPKGTKVLVVGYTHARGDVFFDPSIPLYGVDTDLKVMVLAYLQTYSLWGRTANLLVDLPYTWGETKGFLDTTPSSRNFSGFSDLGVTLSVNLVGAPSMDIEGYQALRADPKPVLGASLKVIAPTGKYDKNRLINEGGNRWAVRGELGYMLPLTSKWLLEFEAGAMFFGDDDDFLPGKREQEPVYSAQMHLVRRIKPGLWAALNFNYFNGGRQTIDGARLSDVQSNSRFGATLMVPIAPRHAIKFGYANGWLTRFGSDFNQILISYQRLLN